MRKISLFAFVLLASTLLASCNFIKALAGIEPDAIDGGVTIPGDPSGEPSGTTGGLDYIDILVGVLAALGLAPAARILALAKPVISPLIRLILGVKKAQADATTPEPK